MLYNEDYYNKYWSREKAHIPDNQKNVIKKMDELAIKYRVGKVLDLGCGNGRLLRLLGVNSIGCDVSSSMVAVCNENGFNVKQGDFEKSVPFDDSTFDTVVSLDVMEHIRDIDSYISEVFRVLKMGGKFLFSVPYHGFFKNLLVIMFGFDRHFNNGDHIRFFTDAFLKNFLESNGFRVISKYHIGRNYFTAYNSFFVCEKK
jgi:SAM-dependent methyltransferase